MILKLIIKRNRKTKKNSIIIWIQKDGAFEEDIQGLFHFFKQNVVITNKRRFSDYYRVTSDNPAIMMSLFSAIHDIIPDIYFKPDAEAEPVELSGPFTLE